jgi:glycosyltransferase involved in cell wall biosynthesis
MALRVPVVAANAGSIPEIVGNAAELVDPLDPGDIARGLSRVLMDSERADNLVQLGLQRASEFSWANAARKTFETVESALLT